MKRPPFARQVREARRAGDRRPAVHVVLGYDWAIPETPAPFGAHVMAVRPADYAANRYDWTPAAGLRAEVVDRTGDAWESARAPALQLAGELARICAPVFVWVGDWREELPAIAFCYSCPRPVGRPTPWPSWWSETLACDYDRRAHIWHQRVLERIQRHAA